MLLRYMQGPKSKFLIFPEGTLFTPRVLSLPLTEKQAGPLDNVEAKRRAPVPDISPES